MSNYFPFVSEDLLAKLEEIFPVLNPTPKTTIETIMYRAGERHVVDVLRRASRERVEKELT